MARLNNEELYAKFEGLAVSVAVRVWRDWRRSLQTCGMSMNDLIQEARMNLFEIVPTLDDFNTDEEESKTVTYVYKSIHGVLRNKTRETTTRNLPTLAGELYESQPKVEESFNVDLENLVIVSHGDDKIVLKLLQDGHNMTAITAMTGLSAHKIRRSKDRIRRAIDRWRKE